MIVGGASGSAASATFLLERGIKPPIIEQEKFRRYQIGESLTDVGGKVLCEPGLAEQMCWRTHPTDQGFKVYGHNDKGTWFVPVRGSATPLNPSSAIGEPAPSGSARHILENHS